MTKISIFPPYEMNLNGPMINALGNYLGALHFESTLVCKSEIEIEISSSHADSYT